MESEASKATHQHSEGRKPRKHAHSSIMTNPTLPQELIVAILVRLPVKYLLSFKCVSKDWLALISGPDFVKAHLRFSSKDYTRHKLLLTCMNVLSKSPLKYCYVSSLFYKSVTEAFDLELPVKIPDRRYRIVVGSVNGLICLRIRFGALVLWNPFMRKFKELSVIMPQPTYRFLPMYGFGYDEVHEDYKVVVIFYKGDCKYDAYIFSLKSDSWSRIEDCPGGLSYGNSATLVSRKLCWVTKGKGIMSYDLVDEKWAKVEPPPCSGVGHIFMKLGLLGGYFCVLYTYLGRHCEVWVMKENGVKESWTKLYTINDSVKYIHSQPLCMSNEGELMLWCGSDLAIYNPNDDSTGYPELTNFSCCLAAQLHMESLVCPIL